MSDDKKDVTEDSESEESEENTSTEEEGSEEEGQSNEEGSEEGTEDKGSADEESEDEESDEDESEDEEESDDEEESEDEDESEDEEESDDEESEEEESDDEESEEEEEESDDEESEEEEEESEEEADEEEEEEDDHHDDHGHHDDDVMGVAAFFDHPDHLVYAAGQAREASYEKYDAYSPFPIHGMDDAMGLGRSWIPWVTFVAAATGFCTATFIEFGVMWYDWPMVYGGKPYAAWPSFVPVMFELTVLFAGVTTALVMLYAAGCFRRPHIIDPGITNDRFVLYVSSDDERFNQDAVIEFMKELNPMEIRTVRKEGES